MTRKQIKAKFRFLLDNMSTEDIPTTDADLYDADDLCDMAYQRYAVETECFIVNYLGLLVPGTVAYAFSAFGDDSAGSRIFKARHVAIDTGRTAWEASTAYAVGVQVLPTVPNGHAYICTTAGTSGATEPAAWTTTAGDTEADGTVVWTENGSDLVFASPLVLNPKSEGDLDEGYPGWRFAGQSTPSWWTPWGERKFRTNNPEAAYPVYFEGYETPDLEDFDQDTDSPLIHPDGQRLLPILMALECAARNPNDEMTTRMKILALQAEAGFAAERERLEAKTGPTVVGKYRGPTRRYISEDHIDF